MKRGTLSLALLVAGCGSALRLAPTGKAPETALGTVVSEPPPPARIEAARSGVVDERCAWVDGQWEWVGRRWSWRAGGWYLPPEGCFLSQPEIAWKTIEGSAKLEYRPPRWYPTETGRATPCAAPRVCPAAAEAVP